MLEVKYSDDLLKNIKNLIGYLSIYYKLYTFIKINTFNDLYTRYINNYNNTFLRVP